MQNLTEINFTLLGQTFAFLIFVSLCYRMVWPAFLARVDARRQEIEAGLAHSAQAAQTLQQAQSDADLTIQKAKQSANLLLQEADQSKKKVLKQASEEAEEVKIEIIQQGRTALEASYLIEQTKLRKELSTLVCAATEHVLKNMPVSAPNLEWIEQVISQIEEKI